MNITLQKEKKILEKNQITDFFFSGIKTEEKIGIEYEKLPISNKNFKATEFLFKNGILDFLTRFQNIEKSIPYYENKLLLGLHLAQGTISLEPGSQIEYSLKPQTQIKKIEENLNNYNKISGKIANEMGINFLALGIQPISTYESIKVLPKTRYTHMTKYLIEQATLPYVMMRETAGIQVTVDYSSEEDAIQKLSTALKLSPFLSAFFANSPIRNGKLTEYKSFRTNAWLNTDNKRCGLISKKLFNNNLDFSFNDYAEILLDLPMIFCKNQYVGNTTFREYWRTNNLTHSDWETHLSLFFPDVRLKNYIELRNHDCQKTEYALAIPAIYKGILYNKDALLEVNKLFSDLKYYDYEYIRQNGARFGIDFSINDKKISSFIKEIISIAKTSLKTFKLNEEKYLEPIEELLKEEKTPADIIIQNFEGSWNKNIAKLIEYSKIS